MDDSAGIKDFRTEAVGGEMSALIGIYLMEYDLNHLVPFIGHFPC